MSVRRAWAVGRLLGPGRRAPSTLRRSHSTAAAASSSTPPPPSSVRIGGHDYDVDPAWFNVPANVLEATARRLHLQRGHPLALTRRLIEAHFPSPTFRHHHDLGPVVSAHQNFDSLGFAPDHPGRARSDTYYLGRSTLLRTHTSAHQADLFHANLSDGYLVAADVYRRDEIDRSHYPVFHQMEGARSWDRRRVPAADVAAAVRADLDRLPRHDLPVDDPGPPFHPDRNPLQPGHAPAEAAALAAHLKRSLANMVADVFSRTRADADEPLRMRWVDAFFPFTSPSWELEVYFAGSWLEVLGCGLVKQHLYADADVPSQLGWAFGLGLERIAMLLFDIPDIRLFWSRDPRFLSQFDGDALCRFKPFSKHPPCPRDVSFWLPAPPSGPGGQLHENDIMELVRTAAGDVVEAVELIDQFVHPKTDRASRAYRITYRGLERTLTNAEVNRLHEAVTRALVQELGVEIR